MHFFGIDLSEKQKSFIVFLLSFAGVYLALRYLLPIFFPFLVSLCLARIFEPIINKCHRAGVPKMLVAALLMFSSGILMVLAGYAIIHNLLNQIGKFSEAFPTYQAELNTWLMQVSSGLENRFHLESGVVLQKIIELAENGINDIYEGVMPYLISHSAAMVKWLIESFTVMVIITVGVLLWVKELDLFRNMMKNSLFSEEIFMIKRPVIRVSKAYLKTQCIIILIVIGELTLGLTLMKNEYSLVLGILIGILDALPIFGTGTVLLPWIVVTFISGHIVKGVGLLALYLLCYFTREMLEPKLMGDGTGMTAVETLVSIYAGLKFLGIWGLFLGPIGWILVKEISKMG